MLVDALKKLRDEKEYYPTVAPYYGSEAGIPARTPEQIAMLDTLIRLFEGDSAEADDWQIYYETEMDTVITYIEIRGADIIVYDKNWGNDDLDPHERMKVAEQIVSGALALRALPQIMARVSELESALLLSQKNLEFFQG